MITNHKDLTVYIFFIGLLLLSMLIQVRWGYNIGILMWLMAISYDLTMLRLRSKK